MNAHALRTFAALAVVLALVLEVVGCSTKQTSPAQLCDNAGVDLIAFSSDRNHHGQYDIFLYDIDGLGYRLLNNINSNTVSDSSPALAADNQLIAFVSARGGTGTNILLYARGSCSFLNTQGLNPAGFNETEPAFSGDISRLLFVRDTLGHRRIRMVNASTSALKLVPLPGLDTLGAFDDYSPAPDRTGDNLVFVSNRDGNPHLYLYQRGTRAVDTLLRGVDGIEIDPAITPDGRLVAFSSNRSGGHGGFDIYVFALSGPNAGTFLPLPGLNTAGDEVHPSLNAAGTIIAFQNRRATGAPWNVSYYSIGVSTVPLTIARMDTTANDIGPSLVFP